MTAQEVMTLTKLMHEGVARKSGRYPWGSGENPHQRNKTFLAYVDDLHKKGLSEAQIAKGVGLTTTELRARKTIAKDEQRAATTATVLRLKEKGMSNVAIGEQLGLNESSVRRLLDPSVQEKSSELLVTAGMLKDNLKDKRFLDIGEGVENHIGISQTKLNTAVAILKEEGYVVHKIKVEQLGTGNLTTLKVLCPPDTDYLTLIKNQDQIKTIPNWSEDGGKSFLGVHPPLNIDLKRVGVKYAEEGGADMDGVILVRPGVEDVSLGGSRYAQVRIGVGGSHYLKGMAMYSDDLPKGVDLLFNTNKSNTGNKLDAMKPMKKDPNNEDQVDPDNPFGSSIKRQILTLDKDGKERVTSAMNIVNEEGDWHRWSKTLSSQMLSKQKPQLAKQQLDLSYEIKKAEFEQISSLTNPAVRKKLMESFADGADSSAVHLKAAGLPRTRNQVLLPVPDMKDTEVFAPQYKNGEKVVLIRHPHGGTFEIPELTVNNRHPSAKKALGGATDAVGISPRTAAKLSGADFDGDTVLVIPNNSQSVRHSPSLEALKDFEPQKAYPRYEGMKVMTTRQKATEMGAISNLITDMTIKGAVNSELARAVKHSMVVIDAEKHKLNFKQSAIDNNIKELKVKYQGKDAGTPGKANSGAATLISRASSELRVNERKPRAAKDGGAVDAATGKKVYQETGASYVDAKGKTIFRKDKTTKIAETDDAHTLSSGQPIEAVYANHANKLKALANTSRKAALETKSTPYSQSAKLAYASEVEALTHKLNVALKNKPLERQAQLFANATVSAKTQANPSMEKDELKRLKGQALQEARSRTGATKQSIVLTDREWEAIQAGAITNNMLERILNNADLDRVKALATPRDNPVMTTPIMNRAKSLLAAGYEPSEVAEALGVSASTLTSSMLREES